MGSLKPLLQAARASRAPIGVATRLIAIDGPGGAGKTTLAAWLAEELQAASGTTFSIELPLAAAEPSLPVPIERGLPRSGSGERVLVVEDDSAVRSVTVGALERAGYAVTEAADGASALRLVDSDGADFAAVVTDLMMPRMSGSQLVTELERRGATAAVVVTSGYPEAVDGPMPGRVSFLDKPFSPRDLISAVQAAIVGAQSGEEPRCASR